MVIGADNENNLPGAATNPNPQQTPSQLVTALQREHSDWITEIVEAHGEVTAIVPREHIVEVCSSLKASADGKL